MECISCDLELLAHLVCTHLWGRAFSGLEGWGLTDSEPCEYFLKNGRSRTDVRLRMGRTVNHFEHEWNFRWVPDGIRSKQNVLPAFLSRWAETERRTMFKDTVAELGVVPKELVVLPHFFDIDFRIDKG